MNIQELRNRGVALVLVAASILCAASRSSADELPNAKATVPDNFVEIRGGLGGAYYVDARVKKRYDELLAEVQALQADVQQARISEAEAQERIGRLRKEVQAALAEIEEKEIFVAPATIHTKRHSETFELSPPGVLLVKANQVEIIGWDKPHVEVIVEKIVLGVDDEPVAAELNAIKIVHRRMTGAKALEKADRQQRAEALLKLTPELLEKHREYFLSMYRWYARLDPEVLAKLPSAVADELRPQPATPLVAMADRRPFERFIDDTIDVVELDGLSYQTGNRQMTLEISGKSGGSFSSVWRRHARLTLYVPKCQLVGVQGGHAGIELAGIDAAVEVKMEDVPGQDATFRVKGVQSSLVARGVPWQLVEGVDGDVEVIQTDHAGIYSTSHYGDVRAQISTRSDKTCTCRRIGGNLLGWFVQTELQIESIGGEVDVRNDFGNTVWSLTSAPADSTQRVVSEGGDIQLRIPKADAVAAPVTALSEVGNVYAPAAMDQLESSMFSTPGPEDLQHSWHGFFTKPADDKGPLALFDRFRRVAKILEDQPRGPGLDLLSRAGTVRILIAAPAD